MGQAITDDELVAASRRGERAAFGALIERHLDAVWAVSFSRTRDRALSDDVAQDTFVAAWAQLDRLRETSRLRAWLCGIARNLATKARRRAGRERPDDQLALVDGAGSPYDALARVQTDRVVERALAELQEALAAGRLLDLAPQLPQDVPLVWQCSRLELPLLQQRPRKFELRPRLRPRVLAYPRLPSLVLPPSLWAHQAPFPATV